MTETSSEGRGLVQMVIDLPPRPPVGSSASELGASSLLCSTSSAWHIPPNASRGLACSAWVD